ncbi:tetratricopeptide repeat protein [uncultured Methanoregula sp.]|uniref:tetratricopeptide repeat protein n=1 Tax=uncultured Methanoregula sp. TaxID=1005933 RepID=UPI002AAB7111|nr:tetratricopeptide repeat protein [uncultured Methanoregula sp.]
MHRTDYRVLFVILIAAVLILSPPVLAFDKTALDWDDKGDALNNAGQFEEAYAAYHNALLVDGDYAPSWYGKGVALTNLGRFEEANDAFDQALLRDGKFVEAWNGKGVALHNLCRCEEAIRAYNFGLSIDPDNGPLLRNRESLLNMKATQTCTPRLRAPAPASADTRTPSSGWVFSTANTPAPAARTTQAAVPRPTPLYQPGTVNSQMGVSSSAYSTVVEGAVSNEIGSSNLDASSGDLTASLDALSSQHIISGNATASSNFAAVLGGVSNTTGDDDAETSPEPATGSKTDVIFMLASFFNKISFI